MILYGKYQNSRLTLLRSNSQTFLLMKVVQKLKTTLTKHSINNRFELQSTFYIFGYIRLNRTFMNMVVQNKRLRVIVLTVALLLLIPLIAMQFTDGVNWTLIDFVGAGALLLGTGLMCELVVRKVNKIRYRIALCAILLVALLLVWLELAVGIFSTPFAGQ